MYSESGYKMSSKVSRWLLQVMELKQEEEEMQRSKLRPEGNTAKITTSCEAIIRQWTPNGMTSISTIWIL